MKTIHKFNIPEQGRFTLELPSNYWAPLSVQLQNGNPCLWVMLDDEQPKETVTFAVRGTGHPCEGLTIRMYVATFQTGPFVYHLFCLAL